MLHVNLRAAFVGIIGLAIPLLGLPPREARAQADSLADWQAKSYAGPIPVEHATFAGYNYAMRTGQWQDPGDQPLFDNYYQKQVFPQITHLDSRGTKLDPIKVIHDHFRQLEAHPGPVSQELANVTLKYMPTIATDPKRHPAARENAILAIAEVKSPEAVDALMKLIQDRKLHPMFKIAAMAGLIHLAEQGVLANPAVAAPVVTLMESYAGISRQNPSDGLRWVRGQAADLLGEIGSLGNDGKVPEKLLSMVRDKELPLVQRGKAARALGRLKYNGNLPDANIYVNAFSSFGSDALADGLPGDARRIWSVSRDFVEGLNPLVKSGSVPKAAGDMYNAMETLRKAASKVKPGELDDKPRLPSAEELKPAVAKAKAVLDAAAKK